MENAKGYNTLESGLVIMLFMVLVFTLIDFSRLFYIWLSLENGISEGVRGSKNDLEVIRSTRENLPTITIPDSEFSFSELPGRVVKVTLNHSYVPLTPTVPKFDLKVSAVFVRPEL